MLKQTNTIREYHNIPYTDSGHHKHCLDIFLPEPISGKKHPVIFFVHGGGWKQGDRKWRNNAVTGELYSNIGKTFADKGFVTVVISYRLSSLAPGFKLLTSSIVSVLAGSFAVWFSRYFFASSFSFYWFLLVAFACFVWTVWRLSEGHHAVKHPDHINDVAQAYAWVHDHISEFDGDNNKIFVMGHSAGAHLSLLLGLDEQYLKNRGVPIEGLAGIVGISGVYNWGRFSKSGLFSRVWYISPVLGTRNPEKPQLYEISPLTHARKASFPILLLNAGVDLHLTKDGQELSETLVGHGTDAQWLAVDGTNHFTIISRVGSSKDTTTPIILNWLNSILKTDS